MLSKHLLHCHLLLKMSGFVVAKACTSFLVAEWGQFLNVSGARVLAGANYTLKTSGSNKVVESCK